MTLVGLASGSSLARIRRHRDLLPDPTDADATCSKCHAGIVSEYAKTVMAHASGAATDRLLEGRYFHKRSKVGYRLQQEGSRYFLDFDRSEGRALHGRRELLYYIGSGDLKGRTYLFEVDGSL